MKKNIIKTIIAICLVCILMFATLSACSDDSYVDSFYDITSFDNSPCIIGKPAIETNRIDTQEQFAEYCNGANIQINDESDLNYNSAVYKKFRSYNEEFFKNKSLIIVSIGKPYPQDLEFANLKIKDGTLTINILNEDNPFNTSDKQAEYDEHLYLIEITKDSIKDTNKIVVREFHYIGSANK